jgi:hypothetical protein
MPYHKPSTAPSLRIDPVACLIHVNAFGLVDRGESFATDRQKYPGSAQNFELTLTAAMRQNGFFFVIK